MSDEYHFIELDLADGISAEFKCTAPEGAECRKIPQCFRDDTCNGADGYHNEDCPGIDGNPVIVEVNYCNVSEWINNSDVNWTGSGTVTLPVTTEWDGDDWIWRAAS